MSDTARMLDETAERMLSRHFATATRGSVESYAALLAETKEAGLDLVLASEEAGGLGAGTLEASAIAYRWGYHAAPGPIVEWMLLNSLARDIGLDDPSAAALALADGLTIPQTGWEKPARPMSVAAPAGNTVSQIVVLARTEPGMVAIAQFDAIHAEQHESLAGEKVLTLDLGAVAPQSIHVTSRRYDDLVAQAGLLTASAILGGTQRLLEITIEHANTRKQFGKQLGKFQAIQHMLAEAASEHVVAQAATRAAIAAQDAGALPALQWQAAKIQAACAATVVPAAAHQILGAIGFTEEHVLHHFSKRLWAWRDDWGRQSSLEQQIGRAACTNADRLWPWMVDQA